MRVALLFVLLAAVSACTPDDALSRYASARHAVSRSLATMSDDEVLKLPCMSAGKHGYDLHTFTCALNSHLGDATTRSRVRFSKIPVHSPCQVHVSHAHRLAFARQPKSASTAVMAAMRESAMDELVEMERAPPGYFVFTFVRNPWTRAASAHRMMNRSFLRRRLPGSGPGKPCRTSFDAFSQASGVMIDACFRRGCCPWVPGAGINGTAAWAPWFVDQHVNDQAGCSEGARFVGRAEHVQEDWDELVRIMNGRIGALPLKNGTAIRNPNGQGKKSNNGVETSCGELTARSIRAIGRQYALDVAEFKFLTGGQNVAATM